MSTEMAATPQEEEVLAEVHATVQEAHALDVCSPEQAQGAVEFLAKIADARKRSERARRFLVDPMNQHVKAINERFKENTAPLDQADELVRAKLLAFHQEEQRRVAEQQARIDAERVAAEEAAEAKRRQQAAEAARIEREAREVEEARQAALREAANERAREISTMDDHELQKLAVEGVEDGQPSPDARLAEQEMSSRLEARQAQERADEARRLAEEAQQREVVAKSAPATTVATTQLSSASGSASTRKVWRAIVVDEALVPRAYLAVDQKAINTAMKAGVREIPGVTIEQVDELAIRAGGR
jgi:hypothetical protein